MDQREEKSGFVDPSGLQQYQREEKSGFFNPSRLQYEQYQRAAETSTKTLDARLFDRIWTEVVYGPRKGEIWIC